MITMSPHRELHQIRNRGRPRSTKTVITCSDKLLSELATLKKQMGFKDGAKILLALSIATGEMVRHVQMFPEIFYLDVTSKLTDRNKIYFSW